MIEVKRNTVPAIEESIAAMRSDKMVTYGDHDENQKDLDGIGIMSSNNVPVAWYSQAHYFSVNPVWWDKTANWLHVSAWSVGGVVFNEPTVQEELDEYNESCIASKRIKCVVMKDGTVIYATRIMDLKPEAIYC